MTAISRCRIVLLFALLFVASIIADQSKGDDVANETLSIVEKVTSESDAEVTVAVATLHPQRESDALEITDATVPPQPDGGALEITVATIPPQPDSDVLEKLFKNYDDSLHPMAWQSADNNDLSKAANITVNMFIRHLKINHDRYEIQLTLRQEWVDPRLNFGRFGKVANYINVPPNYDIWMPDTFFQNELSAVRHKIDDDNVLVRLGPNGHVTYSTRLSLVVLCEQDFLAYPLDEQQCKLRLASYGHVQESVHYDWRSNDPIQYGTSRTQKWLNDLDLVDAVPIDCPTQVTSTGTYSCLQVALNFKRRVTMYMWVLYLPTILLVLISWLAFWLHTNSQLSRFVVGVPCLLLCIALIANTSATAPHTYFLKASDIWNMTVLGFCFLALLESAIVTSAARKYRQRTPPLRYLEDNLENDKLMLREETPYYAQLVEEQPKSWAKRID
uniref:Neurotransmitter-gated ion-channel ligand-binding domain-containing protein n=1 Tax=Plectus sambesii TaxID=2011161 RepID=A0A914ULX6_9BILA